MSKCEFDELEKELEQMTAFARAMTKIAMKSTDENQDEVFEKNLKMWKRLNK